MNIGNRVKFSFIDKNGSFQQTTLVLSSRKQDTMSDDAVIERLEPRLKQFSKSYLIQNGYVLAARNLLLLYPDADVIDATEEKTSQPDSNAAGGILLLALIAVLVAIICFPLLVMLGLHGKLFLKGFYEKCEGEEYKKFAKNYMYVGIGLYALTIILFAVDNIFKLYMLSGPAFALLLFGGIAYFVVSLMLVKKKFLGNDHKFKFIETIKGSFKKKEK